jgi:hypothetical protein
MNKFNTGFINSQSEGYEQSFCTGVIFKSRPCLHLGGCSLIDGTNNNKNLLNFKYQILK